MKITKNKGLPRTPATCKMEFFVTLVKGWKPLTSVAKSSILDAAGILDILLKKYLISKKKRSPESLIHVKASRLLTVTTKIFKTLTILIQSSWKTFLPVPMFNVQVRGWNLWGTQRLFISEWHHLYFYIIFNKTIWAKILMLLLSIIAST